MTRVEQRGVVAAAAMMGWLSLVLWLDRAGGGGDRWLQRALGLATWVVLLVALRRFDRLVRAQVVVVVAVATVFEYLGSPLLEVYLYKFHNVPWYVPPGHGLVYLSAFALGHSALVARHRRAAVAVVLGGLGAWAAYGALVAGRPDVLGALWFACLVGFVGWGPNLAVYVGAGVVVTWLELLGTGLGTWAWQPHDPVLGMPVGNPPSGAAGGYGWFDLAALLVAPALLRVSGRRVSPRPRGEARAPAGDAH